MRDFAFPRGPLMAMQVGNGELGRLRMLAFREEKILVWSGTKRPAFPRADELTRHLRIEEMEASFSFAW